MWRHAIRYGGVLCVSATSFTAGVFYANSSLPSNFFNKCEAAENVNMTVLPLSPLDTPVPIGTKLQPSRASEIMQYGFPGFENLRTYEDFVLSYDRRNRVAYWVVEHLSPSRMVYDSSVDRSKCAFIEDISVHPYFRSSNEDYKRSGYDRGHLAAAGNHRKSQNSVDQTFLLSNMSPQVGLGFNRGKWNELEKHVRKLARKNMNVYVCTGPLYLARKDNDGHAYVRYRVIGKNNVAVPTHFFKVILIEVSKGQFQLESYVLPNTAISDSTHLSNFLTPLDSIERAAGFLIFDKLPKNQLKYINGIKA